MIFGKKYEHRDPENVDAEEYIAKKGYTAKGKKCHQYDLKKVRFIEPLDKPDDDAAEYGLSSEAAPADEAVPEEPIDIMQENPDVILNEVKDLSANKLPDIDNLPEEGDFFEPTLF